MALHQRFMNLIYLPILEGSGMISSWTRKLLQSTSSLLIVLMDHPNRHSTKRLGLWDIVTATIDTHQLDIDR